jgi:uncharacterized protein (TIGR03000 family)
MSGHNQSRSFAFVGVMLVMSLIAVTAYGQSVPYNPPPAPAANPSPPAPATTPSAPTPAANPSPPVVHYHFHQHNYPSTSSLMYPSYNANPTTTGALNMSYPMLPYAGGPTAAQPYPPGYVPGPYAPIGFQNAAPSAPPAQGVIHVFLPTGDAVVYVNGQQLRSNKGKDRRFTTPALPSNREFQYWVTATFKQDGESVTQYRKVIVGAGEYTVADFTRPPEQNPIRLPAGPVDPSSVVPPTPE